MLHRLQYGAEANGLQQTAVTQRSRSHFTVTITVPTCCMCIHRLLPKLSSLICFGRWPVLQLQHQA